MNRFTSIFVNGLLGAGVGFILSAFIFSILAMMDGTKPGEALGYGAVVGVIGAIIGGAIGLMVGILKLGGVGGGITGLLATIVVVLFYVFTFSRPGEVIQSISESVVIPVVLAAPLILTGVITGLFNKKTFQSEQT
jgi:hypothetical protein